MGMTFSETYAPVGVCKVIPGDQVPGFLHIFETGLAEILGFLLGQGNAHAWEAVERVWTRLASGLSTPPVGDPPTAMTPSKCELPSETNAYAIELLEPVGDVVDGDNDVGGVIDVLANIVRRVLCNQM